MNSSQTDQPRSVKFELADSEATESLGRALGQCIEKRMDGLVIFLSGELGAGKTTLVRALLRQLGVTGPIKSPTFTLMEPYVVQLPQDPSIMQKVSLYCYHFDFYRFTDPREWLDAGFRELFDDHALCLVEWPEKALGSGHLPAPDLALELTIGTGRTASLVPQTSRGEECVAAVVSSRVR